MTELATEPFVVIGSGPTGAVAADRLVERGHRVVVLDSGLGAPGGLVVRAAGNTMFRRMDRRSYRYDRLGAGSPPDVVWYYSLSNGGLSNYWTSAVPRFAPEDFTDGARLDERYRWPVTYDELVPYYERAEAHLTVTSGASIHGVPDNVARYRHRLPPDWQQVAERAQAQGTGVGAIPMAKGRPWMVARRGTEFASYQCVLEPQIAAGRLEMIRGAHVTQLVWSVPRGRVEAVEYVDRATGTIRRLAARAVVVAAGTIDTTMILLRSRSSDFPNGLGNERDLVGRYLHDHPREWWPATLDRSMTALSHPVYVARRAFDDSAPLMGTSHTVGLASGRQRLLTYVRGRSPRVGVQVFGTMVPRPDGLVTIDPADTDPLRQRPTITLRYDDQALANLLSGRERIREVFAAGGLGADVDGPFHDQYPGLSVHYSGTARMHDDPEFGVVDAWNRVHDAPEVVVCDMSAFTTGPEKNPTLTAMALAIRAADRLADDAG